ncbi:uncharacterized protein N7529_006366 [Penicillium soppii]|uniref:uncharacterized protein n=1 Tax=Penicillium soppii TaxID=69789 RepID=UPI002546C38B|nr:uncharacterized protein N7529_006366 [Penicillium soppii]KAJ5864450.1 hypothetical protein N7529_006366 [Penicillium soppii]
MLYNVAHTPSGDHARDLTDPSPLYPHRSKQIVSALNSTVFKYRCSMPGVADVGAIPKYKLIHQGGF